MNRHFCRITIAVFAVALALGCVPEEDDTISRDEIPVLQARLYALEQGILNQDRAAIDSLLSVEILDIDQSSDSLLSFVYGPDQDFPFYRLGDYEIVYNEEFAIIDCYVMDSTQSNDRPIKFTFKSDDGLWLLRKFEEGPPDTNSTDW